jgi:hypothetical protein
MKILSMVLGLSLVSAPAFASTIITCAEAPHSIVIDVDVMKSAPPQSSYTVFKDGKEVGAGSLTKTCEGDECSDFLKGIWMWEFMTADQSAIIGVALSSSAKPEKGANAAKSDLFVSYEGGFFDGSTVDCTVDVQ